MQYLVREIRTNGPVESNATLVFQSIPEAVKHLQKINNTERLLLFEQAGTVEQLSQYLTQRLATVSVVADAHEKRQWTITAFE